MLLDDLPYLREDILDELDEIWGQPLLDLFNLKNSINLSQNIKKKLLWLSDDSKDYLKSTIKQRLEFWEDNRVFDIIPYLDNYDYTGRLPESTLKNIYNIL